MRHQFTIRAFALSALLIAAMATTVAACAPESDLPEDTTVVRDESGAMNSEAGDMADDGATSSDDAAGMNDAEMEDEGASDNEDMSEDEMSDDADGEDEAITAADREEAEFSDDAAVVDMPSVTFTAFDFGYEGPASVPAGMTAVTLENEGPGIHQLQLAKLDEGMTMDDLGAFMAENPEGVPPFVTMYGGPNAADPGTSTTAYVDLTPGNWVMLDNIPGPDGVPNVAKGMVQPLEVTEAEDGEGRAPDATMTIEGHDFAFDIPEPLTAGRQILRFDNKGKQPHEITFVRLNEDASVEDFLAAIEPDGEAEGPPPGQLLGGVVALEAGMSQTFAVDLEPGRYALICFLPDTETGTPHFALGMLSEFEIE